ncbi:hypothetical protein JIG36_35235 [Actinoplanes sp. LDG1-06]|uniref:Uncharacterized protein n=1 Tax=Paractinoplanes ovalisporus TaxID=2810368 RepID=A0ABS2ALR4_9ACTN|nr:hypothetical protein [Actinoplanes ovalisporus]MBM2620767.1 hypothetical protein [Actinoplanes ovalisporus]
MGNPTSEEVYAATGGMRADAGVWGGMAGQLDTAAQVARGLTLSAFEFSGLGHLAGLDDKYAELQNRVATMLSSGAVTFDGISDALKKSADDYDRDEQNTVHRMKNVY